VDGDFPFVTVGVAEWQTNVEETAETPGLVPLYLGAHIYIHVIASTQYKLRFRLSFEGIAMRNVEYFRGLNG